MRLERTIAARQRLLDRLPMTGELLRGSLLSRTMRNHAKSCAKCASGEGHPMSVLTVSYPGGRTARDYAPRSQRRLRWSMVGGSGWSEQRAPDARAGRV
jgi:hypothetical protein